MRKLLLFFVLLSMPSFSNPSPNTNVLICVSPTSYAYHDHRCQGLNRCPHEVISVSMDDAINKYAKTKPCGYCY